MEQMSGECRNAVMRAGDHAENGGNEMKESYYKGMEAATTKLLSVYLEYSQMEEKHNRAENKRETEENKNGCVPEARDVKKYRDE